MTRYNKVGILPGIPMADGFIVEGLPEGYRLTWVSMREVVLAYGAEEIVRRFTAAEFDGSKPDALRNAIMLAAWEHEAAREQQARGFR